MTRHASPIAVACSGLCKTYGDVRAVCGIGLRVRRGEILVLVGPSGCGKTTTLRLIAGFERPDAGVIAVAGQIVADDGVFVPADRRRVGVVFQDYALFPHLSVGENVAYGLHGRRTADQAARVREVLALVGLSGLQGRMPHELSGGQQQRVALARALAPRPEVLLLDEPFSSLDAKLRTQVREEVYDILKAAGTAALFVTHDQEEALFMGDRVGVMRGGRLQQVDRPEALFQAPDTRFVAEFMGLTGFLPARVTEAGLETELGIVAGTAPPREAQTTSGAEPDPPIDVLVRPDDLTLEADPRAAARVERRIFRGTHNLYRVALPSGRVVHCFAPHFVRYAPGTPVRVALTPQHPLTCFVNGHAVTPREV